MSVLVDGEYRRIEQHDEPDGSVWSRSEVLGVDFWWIPHSDGYTEFRLKDTVSGEWLNTLVEAEARLTSEQQARLSERRNAERRIATEREARLTAEQAQIAAEQARLVEREARQAAEARAAELEAELKRLRGE